MFSPTSEVQLKTLPQLGMLSPKLPLLGFFVGPHFHNLGLRSSVISRSFSFVLSPL